MGACARTGRRPLALDFRFFDRAIVCCLALLAVGLKLIGFGIRTLI
jgi:hypothetical protein